MSINAGGLGAVGVGRAVVEEHDFGGLEIGVGVPELVQDGFKVFGIWFLEAELAGDEDAIQLVGEHDGAEVGGTILLLIGGYITRGAGGAEFTDEGKEGLVADVLMVEPALQERGGVAGPVPEVIVLADEVFEVGLAQDGFKEWSFKEGQEMIGRVAESACVSMREELGRPDEDAVGIKEYDAGFWHG
jgi:hypothetical protein